jgi:hypothetical protein
MNLNIPTLGRFIRSSTPYSFVPGFRLSLPITTMTILLLQT